MKRLMAYVFLALSASVFFFAIGIGIYMANRIVGSVYGPFVMEQVSKRGRGANIFHPAFWVYLPLIFVCSFLPVTGAIAVGSLLQAYAMWLSGQRPKPDLSAWRERLSEVP